jgi:uncharacterized protein (UPF0332 family)
VKFDWTTYLELAMELRDDPREQCGRTAISRAYYAAFNHAKSFVEQRTDTSMPSHGGAHDEVPNLLQRMPAPYRNMAHKLVELRRLRIWADYRSFTKPSLTDEVSKALAHAERVIQTLQ